MKATISIQTPVHTGSGQEWQRNFDYLYFVEEHAVVVTEEENVFAKIGQVNLQNWIKAIDQGEDLLPHFRKWSTPPLSAADLGSKVLKLSGQAPGMTKTIRAQQAGGAGRPFLAGSSIKGAIRTAILTMLIDRHDHTGGGFVKNKNNLINRRNQFSDALIVRKFLGKDPNHDVFRLLQVGDAHFDLTACYQTIVINYHQDNWQEKKEVQQHIEALVPETQATFDLKFNQPLQQLAARRRVSGGWGRDPYFLFQATQAGVEALRPEDLLGHLKTHTRILIEDELVFLEKEGSPAALATYENSLLEMKEKTMQCKENEAIFRMGWGTGFRNMTGDWQESFMDPRDYRKLKEGSRKKNYPDWMFFPKSRRMTYDGQALGFVKIIL